MQIQIFKQVFFFLQEAMLQLSIHDCSGSKVDTLYKSVYR